MALPFEDNAKEYEPSQVWYGGTPMQSSASEIAKMNEDAEAERNTTPAGWAWEEDGELIELNPFQLKKLFNKLDEKKAFDKILPMGFLKTKDYVTGKYRSATKEDVDEVSYPLPEIPERFLDISTGGEKEPLDEKSLLQKDLPYYQKQLPLVENNKFHFPTFNEMTDWLVTPSDPINSEDNPFYRMWREENEKGDKADKKKLADLERATKIYGIEADKNAWEAVKQYNENEQPKPLHWLGENLDLFDFLTAPVGVGLAPAKALAKMGPITRLLAETGIQSGLEAAHSGIEGENAGVGALTGGLSAIVPGIGGAVQGHRLLAKNVPNDKNIIAQGLSWMGEDASPEIKGEIARRITYPTITDKPLLTISNIDKEINRRIPENLTRTIGDPDVVRMGNRRITSQPSITSKERAEIPHEWEFTDLPDEAYELGFEPELKESFTHDIRDLIKEIPELSMFDRTARKEFNSFKVGEGGVSNVEQRIMDEIPDREYVTLPDLVKALNRFKPQNKAEIVLKERLLSKLGQIKFTPKGVITKSAPMLPAWEETVKNLTGQGKLSAFHNILNAPFREIERDALREGPISNILGVNNND